MPPHHLDAEVAVLGASLLSRPALAEVVEIVRPDDFYRSTHRTVFEAILELFRRGEVIDPITIVDRLDRIGKLEEVGGASAIHDLIAAVPTAANAVYHARIVAEKALLRRLIEAGTDVVKIGYDAGEDVNLAVDRAEQLIYDIAQGRVGSEYTPLKELLSEGFERIEQRFENRSEVTGLPTGLDDLDRLTAGLQKQNLVVIAARPAMGKCTAGALRVLHAHTGAVKTIEEIVLSRGDAGEFRALSLGEGQRLESTEPSEFHDNGMRETWRLRTRLGREIRVTSNHPFLTPTGWRELSDIEEGDLVAVPRELPVFGYEELPTSEVVLLGYFLGDGSLTGTTPKMTTEDPAIASELRHHAHPYDVVLTEIEKKGTRAREYSFARRGGHPTLHTIAEHVGVSAHTVSAARSGDEPVSEATRLEIEDAIEYYGYSAKKPPNLVRKMLERHGVWGRDSHTKFVPEAIFRLRKHQIATFLSRLFSCDGSVWISGHYYGISYSSVSKRLIHDVQHLLLRFGINAYIREKQVKYEGTRRLAYELEIRDAEQIERFIREIGIFSKHDACERLLRGLANEGRHTNVDLLPVEVWDLILGEKGERSWADVSEASGRPRNHDWHVGKRRPSRRLVSELAEALDSDRLREVASSHIYWDAVASIEPYGYERVYDLTIPELHNFVGDDIIIHNSSLSLGVAQYVTVELREPAVIFSLEMSKAEIVDRILSSEARIDSFKIRNGRLDDTDWGALSDAMGRLAEAPLFIDDTPGITLMEIRAKCRRLKQRHGLKLVVVDYLQLMQSHRRVENRVQEVSEISRGLKMIAKELDIPVMALSQLSRQPESRQDKRPQLADLRESGCLTGDTRVLRADTNEYVTMRELYESGARDIPVWTLDDRFKLVPGRMTHVFSSGTKRTYELRLRSGRRIKASGNHPFLHFEGWRSLDELHPGDRIAVPRTVPEAGDTAELDQDEPVLLAHLFGDGGVAPRQPIHYTSRDPEELAVVDHSVSGRLLTRFADVSDDRELAELASSDVLWDEIVEVRELGTEEVFDATVPGTHNFVAEDVVVHNSIEQDADLVGFIYRDEVYDPDTPDRGVAELIISKHRSGPTGVVKLAFLDHLTKFANLARTSV